MSLAVLDKRRHANRPMGRAVLGTERIPTSRWLELTKREDGGEKSMAATVAAAPKSRSLLGRLRAAAGAVRTFLTQRKKKR